MLCSVGIYLFENVEALDFAGPYEVFSTASRMYSQLYPGEPSPFNVFTVSETNVIVRARAGLSVVPDYDFKSHPDIDVLIIPGGVVTEELAKPQVSAWIAARSLSTKITASVCTGSFLLGQAELLVDKFVTTHWEDIDEMRKMFPSTMVLENLRWVDDGHIVTSAGISSGIDMSLYLVERLTHRQIASRTARQLDFNWTENANYQNR